MSLLSPSQTRVPLNTHQFREGVNEGVSWEELGEAEGGEGTKPGGHASLSYAELSPHFGVLEKAAAEKGQWRGRTLPGKSQDGDRRS